MKVELADLDKLLSYAHARKVLLWAESLDIGGGALHVVIEDGNIDDQSVQWCLDQMLSGKWGGYASLVKEWDRPKFIELAQELLAMPILYRELIVFGGTVTEQVFDIIHSREAA